MKLTILLLVSFVVTVSCSSNQTVTNENSVSRNPPDSRNSIGQNGKVYNHSRF